MFLFHRRCNSQKNSWYLTSTTFDTINNVTGVVRAYQEHFQGRSVSRVSVRRTITKLRSRGTIPNRNKENSGRLVTKRTPENIQLVHQQSEEHEGFSPHRNELNKPWRILVITELLLLLCSNTKYCTNLFVLHCTNYIDTLY